MRSGKGKRRQVSTNQKGADDTETFTQLKQEQHMPRTQQLDDGGHEQHQTDNDGDDEGDGDKEHSDGVESQRSWSPVIKPRRRFSASEIQFLEAEYQQDINPSTDQLELIAQTIGTTRRVITTWFQNHRAKGKRNNIPNASITKKHKKPKHVHTIAAAAPKSRARKNNLTQPKMIGLTPGPSCYCINQATTDDGYHAIFSAVSDTVSPLDMGHPSPSTLNGYHSSYFVPDSAAAIPPTITTDTTTWNHTFYPTFSIPLPSSTSLNTWSQSPSAARHPPALPTNPSHFLDASSPSIVSHSALPQCCVDELYTGYPCPFHTLYLQ